MKRPSSIGTITRVSMLLTAGDHMLVLKCLNNRTGFLLDAGLPGAEDGDIAAWMPAITYLDAPPPYGGSVIRVNCGAARAYTDRFGHRWAADAHFTGGKAVAGLPDPAGADDSALYRRGRQGAEFRYRIPVATGLYAVRLRFAEPQYPYLYARPFHIELNGREELRNFDICQDARGYRKAHDRVFHYVAPDADGCISLRFTGGDEPGQATGDALVQAIEILPEIKPATRINCGSPAGFIDWNSMTWDADTDGPSLTSTRPVAQASPTLYDQALYQTARCGREIVYALPLPPGLYTVHLKFTELWLDQPGDRPMDILINGRAIWTGWDPAIAAGEPGMAADLRASNITPDSAGRITITVRAVGEADAILQGIEVE